MCSKSRQCVVDIRKGGLLYPLQSKEGEALRLRGDMPAFVASPTREIKEADIHNVDMEKPFIKSGFGLVYKGLLDGKEVCSKRGSLLR
jgi:hypothetical protein